jgi:hypothetical protein
MRGVDDDGQSPGPEFVREGQERVGNVAGERDGLLDRIDEDRECFRFRPALHAEHFFDRGEIERIGRKGVESIGGHADDTSTADEAGGVVHHRRLGSLRRNFQDFDGQIFSRGGLSPALSGKLP